MTNTYKKLLIRLVIVCLLSLLFTFDHYTNKTTFMSLHLFKSIKQHRIHLPHKTDEDCFVTTGVVDRISNDDEAVILIEKLDEEWNVSLDLLPNEIEEQMWVEIQYCYDFLGNIKLDKDKTKNRLSLVKRLMKRLKSN